VGQGTTKLSLELWFDVTLPLPSGADDPAGDVRNLTKEVAYFMTPQEVTKKGKKGLVPPGVQFQWGTFLFKGTVDSVEETLELFSEDGKPLRAGVQLSLSKQDLKFEFGTAGATPPGGGQGDGGGLGGGPPAGTQPLAMAKAGDTIQGLSASAGIGDWKAAAIANGIENPRLVSPGALINVSGSISGSGAASLGLTGATSVSVSASGGVSIGGGFTGGASSSGTGVSSGAAISVSASGSGSSGLSASASLRFTGPSGPTR
jgi:hypothetical protein